jgi:pimeloyl-ACP methyl ester carboxylesterase
MGRWMHACCRSHQGCPQPPPTPSGRWWRPAPKHVETLLAEQEAVQAIHGELAAARITSLGDLPLVVHSHGQPMAMPGLPDAVNQAYEQLWQELQTELAALSSRSRLVVAEGSGHYIQLERPQLVIDAIGQVVAAGQHQQLAG